MRYEVRHVTRYEYSVPVFLEPHLVRLKPMTNASQRLVSYELDIDPAPDGCSALVDLDGNETQSFWFGQRTDELTLSAVSAVETLRANPFDYLWTAPNALPMTYAPELEAALNPYRAHAAADAVRRLGQEVAKACRGEAQRFPQALTRVLHERVRRVVREAGEPHPAADTLERGEGSCRDIAVLYLAAARTQGFAARFVSGYLAIAGMEDGFDLHAWPELYLPGAGWRGYDPTIGLAVADHHIAVAAAARPEQASPVSGTLRGSARSRLESRVEVRELAD